MPPGNLVGDGAKITPYSAGDPRLLRPANFPSGTPGNGSFVYAVGDGRRILVINAMARLFMDPLDDPFAAVEAAVAANPLGNVQAIVVDFHGEATSEKMAMGHFVAGRAALIVGPHSPAATADGQIL